MKYSNKSIINQKILLYHIHNFELFGLLANPFNRNPGEQHFTQLQTDPITDLAFNPQSPKKLRM
jgi:hypothetical protein